MTPSVITTKPPQLFGGSSCKASIPELLELLSPFDVLVQKSTCLYHVHKTCVRSSHGNAWDYVGDCFLKQCSHHSLRLYPDGLQFINDKSCDPGDVLLQFMESRHHRLHEAVKITWSQQPSLMEDSLSSMTEEWSPGYHCHIDVRLE